MMQVVCFKARAEARGREPLTVGMSNAVTVGFDFSPEWAGLSKTAVFTNGRTTVDVLESQWSAQGTVHIPHEVLSEAGRRVLVGIYGTDGTRVVLPTVWAELGVVLPGADPSGDPSTDPSLPVWAQLHDGVERAQERADVSIRYDDSQQMDAHDRMRAALNAGSIPIEPNLAWWDSDGDHDIAWFIDQAQELRSKPTGQYFFIVGNVFGMPQGYPNYATIAIHMGFDHFRYWPDVMLLTLADGRVYRLGRLPKSKEDTPDTCGELLNVTTINGSTGDVKTTVTVTGAVQEDGTIKASHTAGEIKALADAGYAVNLQVESAFAPLIGGDANLAIFSIMYATNEGAGDLLGLSISSVLVLIDTDGRMSNESEILSAPIASRMVVHVTENAAGDLSCDKTYEEVEAAITCGNSVVLKLNSKKRESRTYSFSCAGDGYLSFTAAMEIYDHDDGVPEGIYSPGGVLLYNNNTIHIDAEDDLPFSDMAAKNPHALTFTGAVEASYDGSAAVSVEIPAGGGDASLGITGAEVGQTVKITAVDETGKPTAWGPMFVYSTAEIDAALGAYITDIDALIGGDA